jgi:FlaA1/EpsC-like NDP-sugar epimerase
MISLAGLVPDRDIAIEFVGIREGEKLHEDLFDDTEILETTEIPGIQLARSRVESIDRVRELRARIVSVGSCGDAAALVAMLREFLLEGLRSNSASIVAAARDEGLLHGSAEFGQDHRHEALYLRQAL